MGQRYTPSNKFSFFLVFVLFVVVTFLSTLLAGMSALVGLWLRRPFSGMVLIFLCGWGIYWMQKKFILFSKNRNIVLARILIFIDSGITAFFHMASIASISKILGDTVNDVLLSLNFKTMLDIYIGALVLFTKPLGVMRAFFSEAIDSSWTVYFFIIIISCFLIPQFAAEQAKKPFSEEANRWMNEVYSLGRFEPFPDREQHMVVSAMKREDLNPFFERPRCSAYDPVDYGQLVFYKIANAHSGFVGVRHFHQKRSSNGQLIPQKYQLIEFIPPIQVGVVFALKLETVINSTAMTGFSNYYSNSEEHGYKLYRTAAEAAEYQYAIDKIRELDTKTDNISSSEENFYFRQSVENVENISEENIPYNPALNRNNLSWDDKSDD